MKERLIGAIVLVALAVLIVPVFLDGPANDAATITQRVPLPGQNDQPSQRQTIVLERDRQQPVPAAVELPPPNRPAETPREDEAEATTAAETDPAPESADEPDPEPAEPAIEAVAEEPAEQPSEDAPAAPPPAPDESETGLYAVQLGSFSDKDNADSLAAELREAGYAAFLSRVATANGELHRVRIGPQKDRDAAAEVAGKLAAAGHRGQVVTHP